VLAFMPVLFLSTGLRTNWSLGGGAVLVAAAVLLVASTGGKLIGTRMAGWLLGWPRAETSVIGWLLQTKGLIMIIFISVLLDKNLISNGSFTALLLMAVASTMLTTPMVAPRLRQAGELIFKTA
jgi:Kef-type K+ transport system membrane component KefB